MITKKLHNLPPPPPDLLRGGSLFLDFDGTLVDIAPRPQDVTVNSRLSRLMSSLVSRLEGRVAIVTGRPLEELRQLFKGPEFAVAGSHGAELSWMDGRIRRPTEARLDDELLAQVGSLEASHPGVIFERKPFGLALHYRLAPQAEHACRQLAQRLAEERGFIIQNGKKVIELKAVPYHKGDAVDAMMREPPMAGTFPVFVGDDETDEAAFLAARRHGGAGILVGPLRPTSANYHLADVGQTLAWLDAAGGEAW
ncbi:MAG: trehalose-phosphatase [Aestuariivirga sp.]